MHDHMTADTGDLRLLKVEVTYTAYIIAYKDEEIVEVDEEVYSNAPSIRTEEADPIDVAKFKDKPIVYSDEVGASLKHISERALGLIMPEHDDDVLDDIITELYIDARFRHSKELNEELFKPGADMAHTYPVIRRGDTGTHVKTLQHALNLAVRKSGAELPRTSAETPVSEDGAFGPKTEAAVLAFQKDRDLYEDGIVGPVTWYEIDRACLQQLRHAQERDKPVRLHKTVKWKNDYPEGYDKFTLRADVAEVFENQILKPMEEAGALMTSSGSKRNLTAPVSANRSATSFHYLLSAFDLFVYSGMVDPHTDPFVITEHPKDPRHWQVWARTHKEGAGETKTLEAVTYEKSGNNAYPQKIVTTTGTFLNFTELAAKAGFFPIPRRPAFLHPKKKTNGAAEWWHFQYEADLVPGVTTFGSQLLRVYSQQDLLNTPPWKYRDLKFGTEWG